MPYIHNPNRKAGVRTVLFDLGNVLVHIQPEMMVKMFGSEGMGELARYEKNVRGYIRQYERGELITDEVLLLLADLFRRKYTQETIREAFLSIIGKPIEGMDDLVRRVGQSAHVALVSNTNDLHYEYSRRSVPALRFLPHHYLSFQIGAVKPEPEFYQYIINDLECDPAQVLFIDDLDENLTGAEKAGFRSYKFSSVESLRAELKSLGLL
jgi:putative hydrolase of the HAD superfamily